MSFIGVSWNFSAPSYWTNRGRGCHRQTVARRPHSPKVRRDKPTGTKPAASHRAIRPYVIGPKRGRSHNEKRAISGSLPLLSNPMASGNTYKIQELIDLPVHRRPDIRLDDIAAAGPIAIRHINFRGVLHFPPDEFAEPVMRAPVRVPTMPLGTRVFGFLPLFFAQMRHYRRSEMTNGVSVSSGHLFSDRLCRVRN